MVDPDVVARRILALNEALANLRRVGAIDAPRLRGDPVLRAAVERWLQLAVETCIDIAFHVVADRGLPAPASARAAFERLSEEGLLASDLAARLAAAASMRNVLVHGYVDLDLELVARTLRDDLPDLAAFGAIAAGWIEG
jgi:uncharacterized protein YutE (UPF0331/DUF86 family)